VHRTESGELVRSIGQVSGGDALSVRVEDGKFGAVVEDGQQT
jgi:hypothetical protein